METPFDEVRFGLYSPFLFVMHARLRYFCRLNNAIGRNKLLAVEMIPGLLIRPIPKIAHGQWSEAQ